MSDVETTENLSLGHRAAKGAMWTVAAQVVVNFLRLAGNLVSARFLDPDAFGLMAIVTTVNIGLIMASDVGIEQSVIFDKRGEEPKFLRTAFSLQVLRGTTLWLIALSLTYPLAVIYGQPPLLGLLPIACLQCFFAGFNSMKFPLNKRKVRRMKELAFIEMGTQFAAFSLIVVLAWLTHSVWALAIGAATYAFTRMALTHILLDGPRDGFAWEQQSIGSIIKYGKWIYLSTLVSFFGARIDVFWLPKLSDIEVLGVYNMGLMLSSLVTMIGFQATQTVLFPALAEAQKTGNRETLRQTFERGRKIILASALWAVTGLTYLGPAFFHYLYRDKFADAGWMLQLQLIFIWFTLLSDSWSRGLMSVDDNRNMALTNTLRLIAAPVTGGLGFLIGGVPGFIIGMGVASIIAHLYISQALLKHGMPVLRLDMKITAAGLPILLFGAFGPYVISGITGWDAMAVSVLLSVLVGVPFTYVLYRFLKKHVDAARHAVTAVQENPEPEPA